MHTPMARISSRTFEVPIEGNDTQQEADKREGSVELIRGRHCSFRARFV
jgi:hypothetical protein